MLVLSRDIGESVVLPECRTKLTILRVSGRRVRVGIDAPRGLAVHREEIWHRMHDRVGIVADVLPSMGGCVEVLWLDDGMSDETKTLSDPVPNCKVRFTVVRTIGDCVEQMIDKRPDLLILDIDAVGGQPQSVLQFVRRDKDLSLVPVILIGNEIPPYGRKELGVTIVDRLNKPISRDLLAEGVTALFSYSNWRNALTKEKWHGGGQNRVPDHGHGACNDEMRPATISSEQHWHSRRKSDMRGSATRL